MELWNLKGVRTSLARGPKSTVQVPDDSVFKMGAAIPIVSRLFMGQRIRHREAAIRKIGSRLKEMVAKEEGKIEKVIAAAEKTDLHSVVQRARSLRDKLEDAACAKVKFTESEEEEAESEGKPGRPKKVKVIPINQLCIKAIAKDLFDKDQTTGMVTGKGSGQEFKRDDLNVYVKKCVDGKGKTTIPAAVVDAITGGAKTGDVEIEVEA